MKKVNGFKEKGSGRESDQIVETVSESGSKSKVNWSIKLDVHDPPMKKGAKEPKRGKGGESPLPAPVQGHEPIMQDAHLKDNILTVRAIDEIND